MSDVSIINNYPRFLDEFMEEPEEDVELEPSLGSLSRKEARQAAAAHKQEVKEAKKNEKALMKVAKQEAKEADIQEMSAFDEEVREPAGTPCLVPRVCFERATYAGAWA